MAASKHRSTPSVPGSSSKRHYNPETGAWDGQLVQPDVVDQLSPAGILEKRPEDWPSIVERDSFADLATIEFGLAGPESSVFRRILFRAGPASQACWESQPNLGRYLGLGERTVRRALARLLELGLVHRVTAYHGSGSSNGYVPVMRIAHSGHSGRNGENEASIPATQAAHSGHCGRLTEGTENVSDPESLNSDSLESPESGDSNLISTSVHSGQSGRNEVSAESIPVRVAGMGDGGPGAEIPECGECGRPWTTDVMRHRTSVHRGLRDFICDACREEQISAAAVRRAGDPG